MLEFMFGACVVVHGLVHGLYLGQSVRRFELQPGLAWPDGSWAFSKFVGDKATRILAGAACALAAIGFIAGGAGQIFSLGWWRPVVVASAIFSTLLFLLFWDGKTQKIDAKGGIGLLIDLSMLWVVLVLQ